MNALYLGLYIVCIFISFCGIFLITFRNYDKHDDTNIFRMESFKLSHNPSGYTATNINSYPIAQDSANEFDINDTSNTDDHDEYKITNNTNNAHSGEHNEEHDENEISLFIDNENVIDWTRIGQILLDHQFLQSIESINRALDYLEDFSSEEDISLTEFRDELCKNYCSINDEGTVLWSVLTGSLYYTKEKRYQFYNLLLHEYFSITDMTINNLILIIFKIIRDLNCNNNVLTKRYSTKISDIMKNRNLNGFKFEKEIQNRFSFVSLFANIRDIKSSQWELIYDELLYWRYQEFQASNEIDWTEIGSILWENDFLDDQDELNSCLDELEEYFYRNNYGMDILKNEICLAYSGGILGINDNDNDNNSVLYCILYDIMNYKYNIRYKLYDILLHKFIDLENLNTQQVILILKPTIYIVDKSIDINEFSAICKQVSLCGRDIAQIQNSEQFSNIFTSISNINPIIWEKIYDYEMRNWQTSPTEYSCFSSTTTATTGTTQSDINRLKSPHTYTYPMPKPITPTHPHPHPQPQTPVTVTAINMPECSPSNEIASALIGILEDVVKSDPSPNITNINQKRKTKLKIKRFKKKKTKRKTRSRRRNTNKIANSNSNSSAAKSIIETRKHQKQNTQNTQKTFPRNKQSTKPIRNMSKSQSMISNDINNIIRRRFINFNNNLIKLEEYPCLIQIIEYGNDIKQSQLLSFIIDTYYLIKLQKGVKYNIATFINNYSLYGEIEENIIKKYNLLQQYCNTGDFMSKMINDYNRLYGLGKNKLEISFNPVIKIADSLYAYISYTISISNAIHKYSTEKPQICPLLIDLWIIPNLCIKNNENVINNVGDINNKLKSNNIKFIQKEINSNNISSTTYEIYECLISAFIRIGLKNDHLNRVIFIIDRRYREKDHLYCYIPPIKYAKIPETIQIEMNDIKHIYHSYLTSSYLLPSYNNYKKGIIGASTNCNGYMFSLSFLMYKQQQQQQSVKYNIKSYFYTQTGKIRFFPNQIESLWPKYFIKQQNNNIANISQYINKLYKLNMNDPYFEQKRDLQNSIYPQIQKLYNGYIHINNNNNKKQIDLLKKQLEKYSLYQKVFCQSDITQNIDTNNIKHNASLVVR